MFGVWDTLIEIRGRLPEADEIAQAERDIAALYPPPSHSPSFRLTDVVERDGRKFVRLSTPAGSMHLMLRRSVKLGVFFRCILTTDDKESGEYRYLNLSEQAAGANDAERGHITVAAVMMADTNIVFRAGPDQFIELSNVERFEDDSGYAARLSVGSIISGRFTCTGHPFYFDDLAGFTRSLQTAYERVQGKSRLAHAYEKDVIEVEVHSGGHVTVTGFIVEFGPPRQELRFGFDCDQTYLPEFLKSLSKVMMELEPERKA